MRSAEDGRKAFEAALAGDGYQRAWRYAWYLSRNREDAEDLLQEALAQAYLHFAQLRSSANFRGWLLSIVHTTHLYRLRQARRMPATANEEVDAVEYELPAVPLCNGLAALPPVLATALLALPAPQRTVLELYYLQELELREVAQVLCLSPAAAKLRLFRAREALRRKLAVPSAEGTVAVEECDGRA